MSDWGKESEQLFRTARRGLSPSGADRERVRARIAAKVGAAAVGVGVAGALGTATTQASGAGLGAGGVATKGITFALVAKILAPIVIAGAGVVLAPRVMSRRSDPPSTQVVVPASAAQVASANANASASAAGQGEATVSVASLPAAEPVLVAAPRPTASAAMSAEEAMLVGEIDAALRMGDAAAALRLAAEHERRFPRGSLAQEREGARVVARCMSGAKSASGADAFLAAHPHSPMRARIALACEK